MKFWWRSLRHSKYSFFFFQAEDGIRDRNVTGVQTCALPILRGKIFPVVAVVDESVDPLPELRVHRVMEFSLPPQIKWQVRIQIGKNDAWQLCGASAFEQERSEERRVGKECRCRRGGEECREM